MLTAEEIAREAADEAVVYEPGEVTRTLSVGAYLVEVYAYEHDADHLRAEVAKVVLAAIERWARQAPPGGLGEARLGQHHAAHAEAARLLSAAPEAPGYALAAVLHANNGELLAHVDHLTRVLGVFHDEECAIYAAGYDAGKRVGFAEGATAQHEADSARALGSAEKGRDGPHFLAACAVAYVVRETPLVTPPETPP